MTRSLLYTGQFLYCHILVRFWKKRWVIGLMIILKKSILYKYQYRFRIRHYTDMELLNVQYFITKAVDLC